MLEPRLLQPCFQVAGTACSEKRATPNLPTNIVPTNTARVKLSGEIPRKSLLAWEFHPLKLRLCWS